MKFAFLAVLRAAMTAGVAAPSLAVAAAELPYTKAAFDGALAAGKRR